MAANGERSTPAGTFAATPVSVSTTRCPVCGAADPSFFARAWDTEYRTTDEVFTYRSCPACTAVFLDPPPVDRLAEIYPRNYYSFTGVDDSLGIRIKRWLDARLFRAILSDISGDRLAVLDVGGGNGWLLSLIRETDARIVETHEVDLDETARPAAEAAGHVFHCTRIESFRPGRRFDLIVLLNIIEHVASPGDVLDALSDCLTEGGRILIKTPNTDTLDRRLFQHRNWGGFHCPRHWVLFTRPGLLELARRSGLEPVWVRYTQGAPQWANSILGWLADRGWLDITRERPMHTHPLHPPLLAMMAALDFVRAPFMKTAQMFVLLGKRQGPAAKLPAPPSP